MTSDGPSWPRRKLGKKTGLLNRKYNNVVVYVWMTKKKSSSIGILNNVGPRTASLG